MSKKCIKKTTKAPWVPPPGRTKHQDKSAVKPKTNHNKCNDACMPAKDQPPKAIKTLKQFLHFHLDMKSVEPVSGSTMSDGLPVKDAEAIMLDLVSLDSNSFSDEVQSISDIHLRSVKQDMALLKVHFVSLKTSSHFLHRFCNILVGEESSVRDLLNKVDEYIKEFPFVFEDLECSLTLVENELNESHKKDEFNKLITNKDYLLSKILESYAKLVTCLETSLGKQNTADLSKLETELEYLKKTLQYAERKNVSQEAVIKDLERRISVFQSKNSALESYKITLEEARSELQKQLSHKETQIKYLNTELAQISKKKDNADNERLIEIIEEIQVKAQDEKTALKKAVKFQKRRADQLEETLKNLKADLKEKEKMMFDIAAQRDQLKVQMTVANNSSIQAKNQIEEMRSQNLKLQNELTEKDLISKKELQATSEALQEKKTLLAIAIKEKETLEEKVKELTSNLETLEHKIDSYRNKSVDGIISAVPQTHGSGNLSEVFEEMKTLVTVLQDTKELLQNLKMPPSRADAGDNGYLSHNVIHANSQQGILAVVQEVKEHLLEWKNLYSKISEEKSNESNGQSELEKQLGELQHLYNTCIKENETLKSEIDELKKAAQRPKSGSNAMEALLSRDSSTKSLQMEIMLKNEEIWKLKHDHQLRERELQNLVDELKDKLRKMEIENFKLSSAEEELKSKKLEIALLEQKREEETERLLRKTKELQESLDRTTADYESLQRYVQILKASYFKVFGSS